MWRKTAQGAPGLAMMVHLLSATEELLDAQFLVFCWENIQTNESNTMLAGKHDGEWTPDSGTDWVFIGREKCKMVADNQVNGRN